MQPTESGVIFFLLTSLLALLFIPFPKKGGSCGEGEICFPGPKGEWKIEEPVGVKLISSFLSETPRVGQLEEIVPTDSRLHFEAEPVIRTGIIGSTSVYLINSAGEFYHITSPFQAFPPRRELLKLLDPTTLDSLRVSLIKADIFEMETGIPEYGGQAWRIVIDGQEKTVYFLYPPANLSETENIFNNILEGD